MTRRDTAQDTLPSPVGREDVVPETQRELESAAVRPRRLPDRADVTLEPESCTRALLTEHGAEVFSFLRAVCGSEHEAREVFREFTDEVFRALPRSHDAITPRIWAYRLAERARRRKELSQRPTATRVSPNRVPNFDQLVGAMKTSPPLRAADERREKIKRLRVLLAPADRALLVLRVDRQVSWSDLAWVVNSEAEFSDSARLEWLGKEARKEFQRVKARLRLLAAAEGLLPEEE